MSRIDNDKKTVEMMIRLYCRHKEGNKELCDKCAELLEYALARLSHCPFAEEKPTCKTCTVHCYKPDMKKRMKMVMRYSGPRILFVHPITAFTHLYMEIIKRKHIK